MLPIPASTVMYVAAPIISDGRIIGVLSVDEAECGNGAGDYLANGAFCGPAPFYAQNCAGDWR